MADPLEVRIITPERVVFSQKVDSVLVPGSLGEMEILPGHVAIFSIIKPGEIRVKDDDQVYIFASGAGFVEVNNDCVKILVDSAEGNADIDPEVARKLIEEAEDKLKDLENVDDETRFAFETQLATARARIEVYERTSGEHEATQGFSRVAMSPEVRS